MLEGHGNRVSINTAHEKSKETSHSEELLESGAIDGGNLQNAQDDHVDHHGPLSTILVTRQAKEGGTDTSKQQSQSDGGGDVSLGSTIIFGQLGGLDRQSVEIKGIGRPGCQSHQKEKPVPCGELGHQTDGVLDRFWRVPFRMRLSILVDHFDSLLPDEEVLEGLTGCGNGALGNGVRDLIRGRHRGRDDPRQRQRGVKEVEKCEGSWGRQSTEA